MKKRRFGLCLGRTAGILLVLLWAAGSVPAKEEGDARAKAAADSAAAVARAEAEALELRVKENPDDGELWLQLGHARLGAGDLKKAEKAFKKAESKGGDEIKSEAYNGLGLVFTAKKRQLQTAVYWFQKALRKNPEYVEALYNKAQVYYKHNWMSHAIRTAREALAIDSTYVPAKQLIDKSIAQKTEGDGGEKTKEAYEKALESNPEDRESWVEWGKAAVSEGTYDEILEQLVPVAEANPEWRDLLSILGQAYWKVNRLEQAWAAFSVYVDSLDEAERRYYDDLSLVTWGDEKRAFERASDEEKREISRKFWAERDADYTTPINERMLEHHRRVWYARTYFARRKDPWDRRGEVYIRYGEPDHRSRSNRSNPSPSISVSAVKERYFNMLYSQMHSVRAMGGGTEVRTGDEGLEYPIFDFEGGSGLGDGGASVANFGDIIEGNQGTMTGVDAFDGVTGGLTGALVGPVFPIKSYDPNVAGGIYMPVGSTDHSLVRWESWTYASINGGIVIDFTDQIGRGKFGFAPIPELGKVKGLRGASSAEPGHILAMANLSRQAPMRILRTAAAAVPERYVIPADERPFDFYFDQAKFRGKETSGSRVEIYCGVPMPATTYLEGQDATGLRTTCRVALADKNNGAIYRSESELIYFEEGDRTGGQGFIPHIAKLDVPPGEYTLDVRMENRLDGEIGVYRKYLTVEPYPPGPLKLSDVQLAWKVTEGVAQGKFSKSGLQIVPMPTRHYKQAQPVYVYYEIYNLRRDEFGTTNYTVEYMIRSGAPPGVISRIFRAFKGGTEEEEISVAQEQLGTKETEASYIELDLSETLPGETVLNVTVKDLNSGETATSETKFTIEDEEELLAKGDKEKNKKE